MPAWTTPLLWVLASSPGRGRRSTTHVVWPRAATAHAAASPTTPAPMIAASIGSGVESVIGMRVSGSGRTRG